jgi:hypothetical protein
MLQIHSENQSVNGSKPVNGRGLQRRKLSDDEIVKLAVDLATGVRSFQPSIEQACALTGAPRRAVAAEIKSRRQNGHTSAAQALVQAWNDASDCDREIAVDTIGVANVWDVIARIIV